MKKVSRNNTNRLRSLLKMFESVGFIVVLLLGATNIHAHTDHVFVSIEQLVKARKTTMLDVFKTIKEKRSEEHRLNSSHSGESGLAWCGG